MRLGTDPRTSALDLNCKMHELDNVYVTGSSFFASEPLGDVVGHPQSVGDDGECRVHRGGGASTAAPAQPAPPHDLLVGRR